VRDRLAVTPIQYRRVAYVTLASLTLIVLTGAAVRLTDSGLGCANWPKCGGTPLPPLSSQTVGPAAATARSLAATIRPGAFPPGRHLEPVSRPGWPGARSRRSAAPGVTSAVPA